VRRVGLKDVLKVMNDVTCTTSRLVSSTPSSSSSSSTTVVLPLQQTVAVCTLLLMTDDSRQSRRVVNSEVTLGKVSLHPLSHLYSFPAHVVQWSSHLGAMCSRAWRS